MTPSPLNKITLPNKVTFPDKITLSDKITLALLLAGILALGASAIFLDKIFPVSREFNDELPIHPNLAHPSFGTHPGAQISIVEFGDYQCPNTKEQRPALERLISEFGTSINFVHKDFPLNIHPDSKLSAAASQCMRKLAGDKNDKNDKGDTVDSGDTGNIGDKGINGDKGIKVDKVGRFEDLLFSHQDQLSKQDLLGYAAQIGVSAELFNSCLEDPVVSRQVQHDLDEAILEGVRGTPTIFINGKPFEGLQSYTKLKLVIESLLEVEHGEKG